MDQHILFSVRNLPCPGAVTQAGQALARMPGVKDVICSSGAYVEVVYRSTQTDGRQLANRLAQEGWEAWQVPLGERRGL